MDIFILPCVLRIIYILFHFYSCCFSDSPKLSMCPSTEYDVRNGKLMLKGDVTYTLRCQPGFVAPWGFPNQSAIYMCQIGYNDITVPRGCIKSTLARRRVSYPISLSGVAETKTACDVHVKVVESEFNKTFRNKGYISDCLESKGVLQMKMTLTELMVKNNMKAELSVEDWELVIKSYSKLRALFEKYVKFIPGGNISDNLLSDIGGAIVGDYYCEPNNGYRIDGDTHVCVGCGKGWWMDPETKVCHPCGPGYYNDEDSAGECKVCEVRFLSAPWASVKQDDCFPRKSNKAHFKGSKLKPLMVPFVFMLVIVFIVVTGSKILLFRKQEVQILEGH